MEVVFGLETQGVTASSPEVDNWCTDGGVVLLGVGINIPGICNLTLCGGLDPVDLGGCEGLESWEIKSLAKNIDAGVL